MYRVPGVKNPKANRPMPINNKFNKNIPNTPKSKVPQKPLDKSVSIW